MREWLTAHYNVQKGMYFDTLAIGDGVCYFGSNLIADSVWNYGTVDDLTEQSLFDFESFCKKIGKPANLYVSRELAVKHNDLLVEHGFTAPLDDGDLVTETWMEFVKKNYNLEKNFDIQKVSTEKQKQDFLEVFVAAYGGEKTPEKPYGDLPDEYGECIKKSFDNSKFYNFVCYCRGIPVSVATLCMSDEFGGLYNVGTKPQYERRGFGLAVTDACINQWISLSGKILFLQTETGTGIDSWYERIGFRRVFDGIIYEKE